MNNHIIKGKYTYYFLIVFLFAAKLWHIHHFRHHYPDKCRQLQNAFFIAEGKGNLFCQADTHNIALDYCQKEYAFPVGYAFTLAKVHNFLGLDWLQSDYLVDICATILLLISLLILIKTIDYERKNAFLLLAFLALSFSPFHLLSSCEQITLSCYLLAIAVILYAIKYQISPYLSAVVVGVLMFFCVIYRYAYYPLLASFPIFTLYYHLQKYPNDTKKALVESAISVLLYLLPIVILQQLSISLFPNEAGGSAQKTAAIFSQGISFYWNNLGKTDGFFFQNLFFISPIISLLEKSTKGEVLAWSISKIGLIITLIIVYHYIKKRFSERTSDTISAHFYRIGLITGLLNIALLLILALLVAPMQAGILDNYTYIQETRYFAPTIFFVFFYFFAEIEHKAFYKYLFSASLLYATLFTAYVFVNIHLLGKKDFAGTYNTYNADLAENLALLEKAKALYPEQRWVCSTTENISQRLFVTIGIACFEGDVAHYLNTHALDKNTYLLLSKEEMQKLPSNLYLDKQKDTIAKGRFILLH